MLVLSHQLLSQRKDILKLWQDKFQYILIDEFQDINMVQYEVIRMLAAPRNNLLLWEMMISLSTVFVEQNQKSC